MGPLGHETRKVQTGEERDTWHIWTPPLHSGSLGSPSGECLLTGGHKDTWHMDWTPPLGPLGEQWWESNGRTPVTLLGPRSARDVHHLWRVGPMGKHQDIVLLCHTLSCNVLPKSQTHTCEWDEEGAYSKIPLNPPVSKDRQKSFCASIYPDWKKYISFSSLGIQ